MLSCLTGTSFIAVCIALVGGFLYLLTTVDIDAATSHAHHGHTSHSTRDTRLSARHPYDANTASSTGANRTQQQQQQSARHRPVKRGLFDENGQITASNAENDQRDDYRDSGGAEADDELTQDRSVCCCTRNVIVITFSRTLVSVLTGFAMLAIPRAAHHCRSATR